MNNRYARFECRICGELVYSPVALDQLADASSLENKLPKPMKAEFSEASIELTCSGGHSDLYRLREIKLVESKPPGRLQHRRAMAAGG